MKTSDLTDLDLAGLFLVLSTWHALADALGIGSLSFGALLAIKAEVESRGRGEPSPVRILFRADALLSPAAAVRFDAFLERCGNELRASGFGRAADFLRESAAREVAVTVPAAVFEAAQTPLPPVH